MSALAADRISCDCRNEKRSEVSLWSGLASGCSFPGDRHEGVETRQVRRRSLVRDTAWGNSCHQDAAERVFTCGDDEQAGVQARDVEYSCDALMDAGENQEAMEFKEAVVRREQDP